MYYFVIHNITLIQTGTIMPYIDWNVVKESRRGGSAYTKDGKIYYRDGSDGNSASYRITLSFESELVKSNPEAVSFGVGNNGDFFITKKEIPNVPRFKISDKKKNVDVYGKDAVIKAIKTLFGITPKGSVDMEFNLKRIDDNTYKFVDVEIL